MAKISPAKLFYSLAVWCKHGKPLGLGVGYYGDCEYGYDDPLFGIYQRRRTKKGTIYVKMNFYNSIGGQSEAQIAGRQKLADGETGWQALTSEQKETYNQSKPKKYIHGHNYYISLHMRDLI